MFTFLSLLLQFVVGSIVYVLKVFVELSFIFVLILSVILIGVFDIFILFLQYISNSIQVMQWCRDLDHLNCCPLPLPKVINSWPASIHLHSTLLTLAHLLATSDKLKGATGQGFKCARVKVCQEWVKESIQMLQGNGLANLSEAIWWKMS